MPSALSHDPASVQHALESAIDILKSSPNPDDQQAAIQLTSGLAAVKIDNQAAVQRKLTRATLRAVRESVAPGAAPALEAVVAEAATKDIETEFYVPRSKEAALIQSAMERRVKKAQTEAALEILPLGEPFSNTDPGWVEVLQDVVERLFKGTATFQQHTALTDFVFPIGDQTSLALFGDWGTGTASSIALAQQIEARNPEHIVHLGDTYYAGEQEEVDALVANFPKPAGLRSRWIMNGNHEMYGGGFAYFKALPRFGPVGGTGQPASYFALVNQNWRIIVLDSAFADRLGRHGNLDAKDQLAWLKAQLSHNDGKKCILLTHHQPFSAFDPPNDKILKQVKPLLDQGKILAWFFGHEHRHVVFQSFAGTLGRCIGHGAIPYAPPAAQLIQNSPPVQFVNRRSLDGGVHGIHGFAQITLKGSKAHVEYVDEDGSSHFAEDL